MEHHKKSKKRFRALIFDVGNVLLLPKNKKRKPRHLLNSFTEGLRLSNLVDMKDEKLVGELRKVYSKSSTGSISKEETLKEFSKKLQLKKEKIEKVFYQVYMKNAIENKSLIKLALTLKKKKYKLGILTYQWHLSKEALVYQKNYSSFDSMVVSCDDKVEKPSGRSFLLILKKLGVKPSESIFIDDMEKNTDFARKLGIKSILFRNNKQLVRDLKKLGVI